MDTVELEKLLMFFYPGKYLKKFIKNTDDIYNNRGLLKTIHFNDESIQYLVKIIINALKSNNRFRKNDCLKVLKRILKNRDDDSKLTSDLIGDLFYLYTQFIFSPNEEIQWCVSIFIKDQFLTKEQIRWLISHYKQSNHIINRLLRYPTNDILIQDWAKEVYLNGDLKKRISEVVALLIEKDIPDFVDKQDISMIIWAIYYAKISDNLKQDLIKKYFSYNYIDSAVEVAMRLGYPEIIKFILKEVKNEKTA